MPRSRFDELIALAEDNDGLVTAEQARQAGFTDSVLTRLAQRGKIERMARAVYRLPFFRPGRFAQCREAVLWAKANRGPKIVAISHDTALAVYGISDANPHQTHLAVPKSSRLRRSKPKGVVVHHEDITPRDITVHEGIPLTTISRTVSDLLQSHARLDLVRQAIDDAFREGFIKSTDEKQLRHQVQSHIRSLTATVRI